MEMSSLPGQLVYWLLVYLLTKQAGRGRQKRGYL